jgi:ABC-type nickel/cobalt efflux system permease component RcnA
LTQRPPRSDKLIVHPQILAAVWEVVVTALLLTALAVGIVHTLTGPDHFVPFVMLARAGGWTLPRTMVVTTLCGLAHVSRSVVIGLLGLAAGAAIAAVTSLEELRGNAAGYLLFGFGLAYTVWALRRAWRNTPHTHLHVHADGIVHRHVHVHDTQHAHLHSDIGSASDRHGRTTPWILFLIFVFGPCEPLIPILMYPAAKQSFVGTLAVTIAFGMATLLTMLLLVTLGYYSLAKWTNGALGRYAEVACGLSVAACGAAVCSGF